MERDPLAPGELDLAGVQVDRLGHGLGAQLDVVLVVVGGLVHVGGVALGLAAQVVLRERRALVGSLGLGADQHHAPVEPLLAQGLGRLAAGQARADDHMGLAHVRGYTVIVPRTRGRVVLENRLTPSNWTRYLPVRAPGRTMCRRTPNVPHGPCGRARRLSAL